MEQNKNNDELKRNPTECNEGADQPLLGVGAGLKNYVTLNSYLSNTIKFIIMEKTLLEIKPNGSGQFQIEFKKEEFPQYGVDEFATEFINIIEKLSGIEFNNIT